MRPLKYRVQNDLNCVE